MLRRINQILDYTLTATNDDNIGTVHDFYFDADTWQIRYLVADIGSWFFGRRVLIAPDALGVPNQPTLSIPVHLTREQIKDSPDIDLTRPLVREQEVSLFSYYKWMPYWGFSLTNPTPGPGGPLDPDNTHLPAEVVEGLQNAEETSNLHSVRHVTKNTLEATDGTIGHITDFFVDDENWKVRYLLIDTGNWLPGRRVLIAPEWIDVTWDESKLHINVTQEQVKNSPEYDPDLTPDRNYEEQLHQHYGRSADWADPVAQRPIY